MKKILIIVFVLAGGLLLVRFLLGGPEDSWVCVDGAWIKHGNPSSPKPAVNCKNN